MNKPLFTGPEWTFELLEKTWKVIDKIARETFGLEYYAPQIEIITSEQMLSNYSSHAMPIMYPHWSFGKNFLKNDEAYRKGFMGLAYEVVINTDPCIAYLMETNSMTMQALVMAHASCGHSSFFKNNYLYKNWTEAKYIIDYLKFARSYIKECEYKYGEQEVESFLDKCHSIQYNSVDRYNKPRGLKKELQKQRDRKWQEYTEQTFNDVWRTVPERNEEIKETQENKYNFPEDNLLYFLEKNSPVLSSWQKEICRIVRKIAQYFYPQMQEKLINEGWATFIHHIIMTEMHLQGHITDGSYLEFLDFHTTVVAQPNWTRKYYSGINIYALGFAMFQDIKRICQFPTEEDKHWFPDICNTDWLTTCTDVMKNYRDESFVLQFLSPKVIRDFRLFTLHADSRYPYLQVDATHSDEDILRIRQTLAAFYDINQKIPRIEITEITEEGYLLLHHLSDNRLDYNSMKAVVMNIHEMWGEPVKMVYKNLKGEEVDDV